MAEPIELTPIGARTEGDYLVIPYGMTPIYLHSLAGKMIAHVTGWTAEKESNTNYYDLYPLDRARHFVLFITSAGERTEQDWYDTFGEPTKEAIAGRDGELLIRARATLGGAK